MRRLVIAAALIGVAACSSARPPAGGAAASKTATTRAPVVARDAPSVSMSSGTAFASGVLAAWCTRASCPPAAVIPASFIPGDDNGVVLFEVGAAPQSARVEVHAANGRLVRQGELLAGTTMAYQTQLGKGRYVMTLVARFGAREGRWVFGVVGPLGG